MSASVIIPADTISFTTWSSAIGRSAKDHVIVLVLSNSHPIDFSCGQTRGVSQIGYGRREH